MIDWKSLKRAKYFILLYSILLNYTVSHQIKFDKRNSRFVFYLYPPIQLSRAEKTHVEMFLHCKTGP